jgi:hypothetical protein
MDRLMYKLFFKLSVTFALLFALTACVKDQGSGQKADRFEQQVSRMNAKEFGKATPVTGGFTENEKVSDRGSYMGNTPDGAKYAYVKREHVRGILASLVNKSDREHWRYLHISSTGTWKADCKANPMSDRLECKVDYRSNVRLTGSSLKRLSTLCLRDHDYPGRAASIRIDGGKPVGLGESGCANSRSLVNKFLNAKTVSISYVKWPYGGRNDSQLMDFSADNVREYLSFLAKAF